MRGWLLSLRKKKELTQAQLAKKAGIARTTYSMIETGERGVSVQNAKKIAAVLEIDWTIFFEDKVHEKCTDKKVI